MKLLAIDSSGLVASAAIVEDDIMRAEFHHGEGCVKMHTLIEHDGCNRGCRRTGIIYRLEDWIRNSKRSGAGAGQATDFCAYGDGAGI